MRVLLVLAACAVLHAHKNNLPEFLRMCDTALCARSGENYANLQVQVSVKLRKPTWDPTCYAITWGHSATFVSGGIRATIMLRSAALPNITLVTLTESSDGRWRHAMFWGDCARVRAARTTRLFMAYVKCMDETPNYETEARVETTATTVAATTGSCVEEVAVGASMLSACEQIVFSTALNHVPAISEGTPCNITFKDDEPRPVFDDGFDEPPAPEVAPRWELLWLLLSALAPAWLALSTVTWPAVALLAMGMLVLLRRL